MYLKVKFKHMNFTKNSGLNVLENCLPISHTEGSNRDQTGRILVSAVAQSFQVHEG